MAPFRPFSLFAFLTTALCSAPPPVLTGDNITCIGRHQKTAAGGVAFDMNGVQCTAVVSGTGSLYALMSQVQMIKGNVFQVFVDGVLQPQSRFNTSQWTAAQVVKVPVFAGLDASSQLACPFPIIPYISVSVGFTFLLC